MSDVATPALSVVVINHNYGRFLGQCVDSVLAQTRPPAEVIVVDDGSTDNSREVIAGYGRRVTALLQPNAGHVAAFNAGFARASGEVLIFLDADDFLYPDCLREVAAAWEPGLSKLQYRLDTVDEQGADQGLPFPYFPPDLGPEQILRQLLAFGTYPWTVSSGCAFARDFLAQVTPIDSDVFFKSPDGYANKLAPLFGPVKTLPVVLGAYRVHGANAWAQEARSLRAAPFTRNACFDIVMHQELRRLAEARGHQIPDFDAICTPGQVEARALSFRLAPGEHPYPADCRGSLARLAARSAARAPNTSPLGRLLWRLWLQLAIYAPRPLLGALYARLRGQSGRAAFARPMLNLARGAARLTLERQPRAV